MTRRIALGLAWGLAIWNLTAFAGFAAGLAAAPFAAPLGIVAGIAAGLFAPAAPPARSTANKLGLDADRA